MSDPVLQQSWLPPSDPLYKVNVDGAVFKARNESEVGAIVRDANGMVVAALSKKSMLLWVLWRWKPKLLN